MAGLSLSRIKKPAADATARHQPCESLSHLEIFRRFLAAIGNDLVLNVLAFVEGAQSGALDGGDVNEHILATTLRLDKAVTLGRVEPLHSACSHYQSPSLRRTSLQMFAETHECQADISSRHPLHSPNARPRLPRWPPQPIVVKSC